MSFVFTKDKKKKSVSNADTGSAKLNAGLLATIQSLSKRITNLEPVIVDKKDFKSDTKLTFARARPGKMGRFIGTSANSSRVTFVALLAGTPTAANTPNQTVFTLTPGTGSEFSSFASIYDDWRTTHVEFHMGVGFTVTTSGAPAVNSNALCMYGMVYDPVDSTALTSVIDSMDYDHRVSPCKAGYDGVNAPTAVTPNGLNNFKVKVPAAVVDPGISLELLDSNWVSTKDAAVVVGYCKTFCETAGALTSSTFRGFARFTCEFKSRR